MVHHPAVTVDVGLSAGELASWRAFSEGGQLIEAMIDRRLKDGVGITHADYGILRRLQDAEEHRMSIRDLRHDVWFSRSRLTHQLKRLEVDGLVTKSANARDGRSQDVALTSEGLDVVTRAQRMVRALLREHFFDQLAPGSVDVLSQTLQGMVSHLRAQPECQVFRNS
ncbi:MarR family winged helix-turn-helix transcriptional regulator [Streptomyces xiangluensis]|uniref:MarR family winged helix-turn-helix transcriptional regulator n=1 Tax=Streptomyces xiangluensis TaxID=2665720 RepID=A0ABV8YRN1_9ACTN